MATENRTSRREQKRIEAAAGTTAIGAIFTLGPLFLSRSSPFRPAVVQLLPIGFLLLAIGIGMLWWHVRTAARGTAASSNGQRSAERDARVSVLRDDRAAVREHAPNREAGAERPREWSPAVFDVIEWRRFEALVEELFKQAGFITKSQSHGADGGVDIWLYSKHQADGAPVSIVQCKHWSGKQVGVDKVRELRGVMASHDIKRGQFATTSEFSQAAEEFAAKNGINLLNGRGLLALIRQRSEQQQAALLEIALAGEYQTPTCVNCGIKLIERTPKGGGKAFWGCQNFPRCRKTMPMCAAFDIGRASVK